MDRSQYMECVDFLNQEAELLDNGLFNEWFALFTEDFVYQIPVRFTRERAAGSEFSSTAYHMNETLGSMEMRIARAYSEYNWAEDPPSRTRHFITNVRVRQTEREDEVKVVSNVLVYRNKFDNPTFDLLSAERHDVLRKVDGNWKLAKRVVYLDQSTVATNNFAIFI